MLIFECFNDKSKYISPIDEIKIYHETIKLIDIWKNTVLKNSNKRITELPSDHQKILSNIIPYLKIKFRDDKIIGPQVDRQLVSVLLWSSSVVFQNKKIVDEIFAKTKNSVSQYFHQDLIIKSYLYLKETNLAISVINHLFDKDHSAYYYTILNFNFSKISDQKFEQTLLDIKERAIVKLLSRGEKVNLQNVSYDDLLKLIKLTNEQ